MPLKSAINAIEQILVSEGYTRAKENFTLDRVASSTAHRSYTLGSLEIRPRYLAANVADYLGARLPILILFRVHGPHNPDASYQQAYLQAVEAFQQIENALVAGQLSQYGENVVIDNALFQPLAGNDNQEYILLTIHLSFDLLRSMNQ